MSWRLIYSDPHYHNWSAFSGVNENGVNTRLQSLLAATSEAFTHLIREGGRTVYNGGDMFHVRGSVAPSVFNPVVDLFTHYRNEHGINAHILAGNHDLESKDSRSLTNAGRALTGVATIYDNPKSINVTSDHMVMFPWFNDPKELLDAMREYGKLFPIGDFDALIHAPVNGVIKGIPDHGIEASELASIGFRRVFVGHYHDHKVMEGGKVVSIGALTHQTWGDVGTKAGYLLINDHEVRHFETTAPKFVDLGRIDLSKISTEVQGNFVRLEAEIEKDSRIEEIKGELRAMGAAGVIINPIRKKPSASATKLGASSLATMEGSISAYIDSRHKGDIELKKLCLEILSEIEAV